jgi:hypothetical protein
MQLSGTAWAWIAQLKMATREMKGRRDWAELQLSHRAGCAVTIFLFTFGA